MYFGGVSLLQGRNIFLMYLEVTLQGRIFSNVFGGVSYKEELFF